MKQESFKILKGIPLPKRSKVKRSTPLTSTLSLLKVGECFDFPFEGRFEVARTCAYVAAKRLGMKVRVPFVEKSPARVWRVE